MSCRCGGKTIPSKKPSAKKPTAKKVAAKKPGGGNRAVKKASAASKKASAIARKKALKNAKPCNCSGGGK